jgi:mono/diheme cytochrome c family protein
MNQKIQWFNNLVAIVLFMGFYACDSQNKKKEDINKNYLRSELSIQEGMVLFNQNCANCHNFNNVEIGPNLGGITYEVDKEWIKKFIQSPQKMIESGDERAVAQFEKFGVYMPSFAHLEDQDLENLLAFIHKLSQGEKRNKSNRPGGLINPIQESITKADHRLILKDFTTIPASSEIAPDTRINTMRTFTTAENSQRFFISDLRGRLYEIVDQTPHLFLDLKSKFPSFIDSPGHATGFGSFAFHPEFENNGLLYTTHTEPAHSQPADFPLPEGVKITLQWVLMEWKAKNPQDVIFKEESSRELLRVDMLSQAHGVQEVTFNPYASTDSSDYGLLFIGVGDGSLALSGHPDLCDSNKNIWSNVLRIDPLGSDSKNGKYGIPKDNPFINADGLDEIWCMGFRNPHRISWDAEDPSRMFVSNIGQHSVEEVNLAEKAGHFGWPLREGTFVFDVNANPEVVYPLTPKDLEASYIPPVAQYDHDEGNAVSGGFLYRGRQIPSLVGNYLFGDIARGTIFISPLAQAENGQQYPVQKVDIVVNGKATSFTEIRPYEKADLRFGQDSAGELYVFTKSNGKVYRVVDYSKE